MAISDIGQIVGDSGNKQYEVSGFSWMESTGMIELPPLEGHSHSETRGVNNVGQVIGSSSDDGGWPRRAVVWSVPLPPPPPEEAIGNIADDIAELVSEGVLATGQANSLTSKLDTALVQLDKGNEKAASNVLQAFINQLTGLVNAGVLTIDDAQPLIDAAEAIIDQLTGG